MLRITLADHGGTTVLKVEGKLLALWVPELMAQYRAALESSPAVALDLGQVSFIDTEGLAAVRELLRLGIELRSCNGFVHELLHLEAL